ncbi:hypothetical protein A499_18459 [Niallia nealsonii AAU1]|jgi:hypothetical protein|nr:hypothetical protein A499_18459 [Niallia nealsonii AAU1]
MEKWCDIMMIQLHRCGWYALFSCLRGKGGDIQMDFVLDLLKDVAKIFFTTLAAGYANRFASKKKNKRKPAPRRRKQKGGSSK